MRHDVDEHVGEREITALAGALAVASGLVSPRSALAVLGQVGPVLLFLGGITAFAELADGAGVFAASAAVAARIGGGSVRRLFALILLPVTKPYLDVELVHAAHGHSLA
jgi:arsenical pump membrane protein